MGSIKQKSLEVHGGYIHFCRKNKGVWCVDICSDCARNRGKSPRDCLNPWDSEDLPCGESWEDGAGCSRDPGIALRVEAVILGLFLAMLGNQKSNQMKDCKEYRQTSQLLQFRGEVGL